MNRPPSGVGQMPAAIQEFAPPAESLTMERRGIRPNALLTHAPAAGSTMLVAAAFGAVSFRTKGATLVP